MKLARRIDFVRHFTHGAVLLAVACATPPPTAAPSPLVSVPAVSSSPGSLSAIAPPGRAGAAWWAFLGKPAPSRDDGTHALKQLDARLRSLPPEQVLEIHRAFEHELMRSYRWELWGAAYLINGGCSDDCFDYFRGWLLLQGQDVFDAALRDPDTLAELAHIPNPPELEEALSLTTGAYQSMTGQEPQSDAALPRLGPGWDFDDPSEKKKRYPKLSVRFSAH